VGTGPTSEQSASTPVQRTGSAFTVAGNGDIAPDIGEAGGTVMPISHTLDGLFAGLIAAIVIGAVFMTAEFRRGLIRTTLTASPDRGRVLAAKAVVVGVVTFAGAFIGCLISVPIAEHVLRGGGNVIQPVSALTLLRVVAGTAIVFAATAVFAVALGTIFRRGAGAVTSAFAIVVVPWFLGVATPGLPAAVSDWMLRISPAAGLAVQQTIPRYPQIAAPYLPADGFYPLTALAGFAVLCLWTAGALWLAAHQLRRGDV
jgi:ABC-type transport system involved in multi-copper enzyme maturation permease subunit